jgi:hypothetical protein
MHLLYSKTRKAFLFILRAYMLVEEKKKKIKKKLMSSRKRDSYVFSCEELKKYIM